jgi:hypothetical protein
MLLNAPLALLEYPRVYPEQVVVVAVVAAPAHLEIVPIASLPVVYVLVLLFVFLPVRYDVRSLLVLFVIFIVFIAVVFNPNYLRLAFHLVLVGLARVCIDHVQAQVRRVLLHLVDVILLAHPELLVVVARVALQQPDAEVVPAVLGCKLQQPAVRVFRFVAISLVPVQAFGQRRACAPDVNVVAEIVHYLVNLAIVEALFVFHYLVFLIYLISKSLNAFLFNSDCVISYMAWKSSYPTNQLKFEFLSWNFLHFYSEVIEFLVGWLDSWIVGLNIDLKNDPFFSCSYPMLIPYAHTLCSYELHFQPLELEDCIDPEQVGGSGVDVLHEHIRCDKRPLGCTGVYQHIKRYVM